LKQTEANEMIAITQKKGQSFNKIMDNTTFDGCFFIGECHYWQQQKVEFFEVRVELQPVNLELFQIKIIKTSGEMLEKFEGITLRQYFFFNLSLLENETFDLYYQNRVIGTVFNKRMKLHLEVEHLELFFEGEINLNENYLQ